MPQELKDLLDTLDALLESALPDAPRPDRVIRENFAERARRTP